MIQKGKKKTFKVYSESSSVQSYETSRTIHVLCVKGLSAGTLYYTV